MTALTVAEVLRRAAVVIDERGHHKGWYVAGDGGAVCVLGACAVAAGLQVWPQGYGDADEPDPTGPDDASRVWQAAIKVLEDLVPNVALPPRVTEWNDEPGRTTEQVKAALLAAAEYVSGAAWYVGGAS